MFTRRGMLGSLIGGAAYTLCPYLPELKANDVIPEHPLSNKLRCYADAFDASDNKRCQYSMLAVYTVNGKDRAVLELTVTSSRIIKEDECDKHTIIWTGNIETLGKYKVNGIRLITPTGVAFPRRGLNGHTHDITPLELRKGDMLNVTYNLVLDNV